MIFVCNILCRIKRRDAKLKREKRKKTEIRKKVQKRIDMKMILPDDNFEIGGEEDLFALSKIKSERALTAINLDAAPDIVLEDEEQKMARLR
jgi:hypothetical protein